MTEDGNIGQNKELEFSDVWTFSLRGRNNGESTESEGTIPDSQTCSCYSLYPFEQGAVNTGRWFLVDSTGVWTAPRWSKPPLQLLRSLLREWRHFWVAFSLSFKRGQYVTPHRALVRRKQNQALTALQQLIYNVKLSLFLSLPFPMFWKLKFPSKFLKTMFSLF